MTGDDLAGTIAWRELRLEARDALAGAGIGPADQESWWLVEEASGMDRTELVVGLEQPATVGGVARLDALVARRCAGEPVQYVLGHWPFRSLDLLVDRRVLIPRPETEQVAEAALAALDEVLADRPAGHRGLAVDLGTGSGALALAIAAERPGTEVWATERSAGAVEVARANLAGLGMAGSRVRVVAGSWFEPLPAELAGAVDLVVSNPPYIGTAEPVARSVVDWEPADALFAGPTGLAAYEAIVPEARRWLAPGGALVLELGAGQADDVAALADGAGFGRLQVVADLAGLDRALVARRT